MRNDSIKVVREIGVDTGGANVQFAINPKTGRNVVIEMNPRVSRSSALASKQPAFQLRGCSQISYWLFIRRTQKRYNKDDTRIF